jgi:hypothetical protein
MSDSVSRRDFFKTTALAGARVTAVAAASIPAAQAASATTPALPTSAMPMAKIGSLTVSRLISGGNLISGWAHARDLRYLPSLMRAYNTPERVLDTLAALERHGVNTIIADPRKNVMEVLARHWKERGGRIQWIAEGHPDLADWKTNIRTSIEFGAKAVYVQGVIGDKWLNSGHTDLLGECVQFIKSQGVPGGLGAHKLEVIQAAEKAKFGADFYVKTLHHANYWSRQPQPNEPDVVESPTDNYWDIDPDRTVGFMSEVEKPWIAFKVLAAGAIPPKSGFRYAFENGADCICVGMFDFQVEENAALVCSLLKESGIQNRPRAWMA